MLALRADAASPPAPQSFGELADRLGRPASINLALPKLTRPQLQVAEVAAAVGTAPGAVVAELLGVTPGDEGLAETLRALADHALVWPDDDGLLHMPALLREAWEFPLGLDAPLARLVTHLTSEQLRGVLTALGIEPGRTKNERLTALADHHTDGEQFAATLRDAPAPTLDLLRRAAEHAGHLAQFGPGHAAAASVPGARWAVERGLLIERRYGYGPPRMPAEVALMLRGPRWRAPFDPVPPPVPSMPVAPADVEREAAAAAMVFTAHATSVLALCATAPPARLRTGGIGTRELARITKAARCDEVVVRLVLETAYDAGLLTWDDRHAVATEAYDLWTEEDPARQLAELLQAWRWLPFTPTRRRDSDGKALPALARTAPCGDCARARDGLLTAASLVPPGRGAGTTAQLGPLVGWLRPAAHQLPEDESPFATVAREAELLGVIAHGALSPLGAALRDDDPEALAAACEKLLPRPTSTARFGADLTAVVTGTPSARLVTLLDAVADKETGGAASVWRFAPGSVRRALDAGRTPEAIVADLTAVAVGALPQPLTYLIHDTARTHGRVRVTAAACVIHSEESALLAEIAAHRRLRPLGLRQVAPTVLIGTAPLDQALDALRAEGYAPVGEAADGTVRVETPRRRRAPAPLPAQRAPAGDAYNPAIAEAWRIFPDGTGAHLAAETGRIPTGSAQPAGPAGVAGPADAEGPAGTAGSAEQPEHPRPVTPLPPTREAPAAVDVSDLAASMRAAPVFRPEPDPLNGGGPYGTDIEEIVAGCAKQLSYTDARQLAHAIFHGLPITIEYVNAPGNRTERVVSDMSIDDAPYLYAWCHLRNEERVFHLGRIQAVMPA